MTSEQWHLQLPLTNNKPLVFSIKLWFFLGPLELQLDYEKILLEIVNRKWHQALRKKTAVGKSWVFIFSHFMTRESPHCLWWTSDGYLLIKPMERINSNGSAYQQSSKHIQETGQMGGNDFIIIVEKELEHIWLATVEKHKLRVRGTDKYCVDTKPCRQFCTFWAI